VRRKACVSLANLPLQYLVESDWSFSLSACSYLNFWLSATVSSSQLNRLFSNGVLRQLSTEE
jgi:hypothetical protein